MGPSGALQEFGEFDLGLLGKCGRFVRIGPLFLGANIFGNFAPALHFKYREEAGRLAQLPVEVQRQILDIHRSTANDLKLRKRDRKAARERLEALERFLGLAAKDFAKE